MYDACVAGVCEFADGDAECSGDDTVVSTACAAVGDSGVVGCTDAECSGVYWFEGASE